MDRIKKSRVIAEAVKQAELNNLPEDARSRLEAIAILYETGIEVDEFYCKMQPSVLRWALEDIEREVRRLKLSIKANTRRSFASALAKLEGGDSLFELRIKKMLEKHLVEFKYHEVLVLGTHRYKPDFLIGTQTILEVAGVPIEYYWKHFSEKVKDYVEHGYIVHVIVLDKLLGKAKKYLPKSEKARIIKYGDFKYSVDKYAAMLRAK